MILRSSKTRHRVLMGQRDQWAFYCGQRATAVCNRRTLGFKARVCRVAFCTLGRYRVLRGSCLFRSTRYEPRVDAPFSPSSLPQTIDLRFRPSLSGTDGVGEAWAANTGHFVCFHVLLGLALLSHVAVTVSPRQHHHRGYEQSMLWCLALDVFSNPVPCIS